VEAVARGPPTKASLHMTPLIDEESRDVFETSIRKKAESGSFSLFFDTGGFLEKNRNAVQRKSKKTIS
jgi:hypothetical protein